MVQDVILILFIALVSFVFGATMGRRKLVSVLLNIYISAAILSVIPEGFLDAYVQKLAVFLILVIGLTFIGKKLFDFRLDGSGSSFLWRVFTMSFLEVVLFLSIILSIVPQKESLAYISSTSYHYLTDDSFRLVWMVLPLAFMIFIHKKLNR